MLWKYWKGTMDKKMIEEAVEILEASLQALMTKIELANQGAIRGQNITLEQINMHAMKSLRDTESGIQFWRDFVQIKEWIINT